jgi:hypothetical protein
LQPFFLIERAAGAAMSSAPAARRSGSAGTLLLLDNRMVYRERGHEQHNDEHVKRE